MQRFIALDVGKKRTGVALVDDEVCVATPLTTIAYAVASREFLDELIHLIGEWEPARIVVGLPIDLRGKESVAAQDVRVLSSELLERINSRIAEPLEIVFVDERLTTAQAENALRGAEYSANVRKSHRDALAAAVIAQTYIDTL